MKPLQIFIGYDSNEPVAYHVLSHSIMRRASVPVAITPLYAPMLRKMQAYSRERGKTESTEFSLTRFLSPWLSGFNGISIFMDCDMLCLGDVAELVDYAYRDPYKDVFVVKHDYTPRTQIKFLGQTQTQYPCKNWSSVMVFNGHRSAVRSLRPEYIDTAHPGDLHQFKWAQDVGELPPTWNHLVGEYGANPEAKLVHFTLGGPYFPEYFECEYSREWFAEAANALSATGGGHLLRGVQESDPAIPQGAIQDVIKETFLSGESVEQPGPEQAKNYSQAQSAR